jgi:hypothetical protein
MLVELVFECLLWIAEILLEGLFEALLETFLPGRGGPGDR